MDELLNHNLLQDFGKDSVYHYHEPFTELTDSLSTIRLLQHTPEAVYGQTSTLTAPVKSEQLLSRSVTAPVWEGWMAIGILFIFFLFSRYIGIYFRKGTSGLFSLRALQKQFKENSLLMHNIRQVLFVFSSLVLSFWIYLWFVQYTEHITLDSLQLYMLVLAGTLTYFLVKAGIMWLMGVVNESREAFSMLTYSGQLCVIATGILVLPLSITLLLANEEAKYAVNVAITIICSLSFLLYFIRSFQIFHRAKFSFFFWILYLCTLEIVPFLILYSCFIAD